MGSVPLLPGAAAWTIDGFRIAPDAVRFSLLSATARQACLTCGRHSAGVRSKVVDGGKKAA